MRDLLTVVLRVIQGTRGPAAPMGLDSAFDRRNRDPSRCVPSATAFLAGLRDLLLLSALFGGGYWLWSQDWSTGEPLEMQGGGDGLPKPLNASVLGLSWSADGRTFLSRSVGHAIGQRGLMLHRVVDQGTVPSIATEPVSTGELAHWNAVLMPDASAILVVAQSNCISRIDLRSGIRTDLLDVSEAAEVPALAGAQDGTLIAVALDDGVRLCDSRSGQERLRLASRSTSVKELVFSESGGRLAAAYADGAIRIWNCAAQSVACDLARHAGPVAALRFVDGERRLASVGCQGDDTLRLWDLESGALLWHASAGQMGLHALAVSADGRLAATGGNDNGIVIWDLNERARVRHLHGHAGTVKAVQFLVDATILVSASTDGTICVWDMATSEPLYSIGVADYVLKATATDRPRK